MSRYRHEYKYMIDACQEQILKLRAEGVLMHDPHVRQDGTYLIRSAYFDDIFNSCMKENVDGTDPRSKFRIRYYNSDTNRISLEKKSKNRGMTLKDACRITKEECAMFLEGEVPPLPPDAPQIKQELFNEVMLRGLTPQVIVSYERTPFVYTGGNVRVTFDGKITSSNELDRFLDGDYITRPVLPAGASILEVKWDELLPRHIREALSLEGLQWTAFSKYFMCRLMHL